MHSSPQSPTKLTDNGPRPPNMKPIRQSYRAARAFYLTLLLGTCLATYSLFSRTYSDASSSHNALEQQHLLHRRQASPPPLQSSDEECRLVHRTPRNNQCAFIHTHCPSDESGFMAYLSLFYCDLPHAQPLAFLMLIAWLGLLFSTIGIAASDFFCINLSTIAAILGMSESMAGVTFLAFGNGSPDVFSTFAAMSTNSGSLAVGELFGAAGFITAIVAGSMALIRPFHVAKKSFVRDVGFFVVAAAFSMVFLWDGKLVLWECIGMVGFYIFYVAFVVAWHWWIGRRRQRREKEAAARGHFVGPGDEYEVEEEYRDDPEEAEEQARPGIVRGVSREDWSALERGGYTDREGDEDEEEEARDRWMSELSGNMRLTRPAARSRKSTLSTVRPSLVGALEFQAVLHSLQKSRNIQTIPMSSRRYSDDPSFTSVQQQDGMSTVSDPAARPPFNLKVEGEEPGMERHKLEVPKSSQTRTRAVSANDAAGLKIDADLQRHATPPPPLQDNQENLINVSDFGSQPQPQRQAQRPHSGFLLEVPGQTSAPQSPGGTRQSGSAPGGPPPPPKIITSDMDMTVSPANLSPSSGRPSPSGYDSDRSSLQALSRQGVDSPKHSPRAVPRARNLPKLSIPREDRQSRTSSPATSPFPRFQDDPSEPFGTGPPSLQLPPPSIASPESLPVSQVVEEQTFRRPVRWWPYQVLPPPGVLVSTLLPTIYHWREKTWWEKCLGVVAAPSVFLLTITLPVVENDTKDNGGVEDVNTHKDVSLDSARSKSVSGGQAQSTGGVKSVRSGSPASGAPPGSHHHSRSSKNPAEHQNLANLAMVTEQQNRHNYGEGARQDRRARFGDDLEMESPPVMVNSAAPMGVVDNGAPPEAERTPEEWNRWLTIIQLFTAPLFVVLAIYSQSPTGMSPKWLIKPTLICLLISLVLLVPFLMTTTPTSRPQPYRTILSLSGFVVSIAWISTIAAQVVGALKALAVILNMSHAIMGLTIFAVGNSLGDLVADVTVAKLGYPVMALSACFGGPMLNILLGIGLSGSYILIRGAERRERKHPDQGLKFKAYHIDVSSTLIVSGATLLVTLLGLLVFVPMNRWILSRRIGWTLITLWTLSTIGNVVLEVTGVGDRWGEG
ncbi:hypothetical protein KC351_g1073 [Hortaea werneckii]|nr:hypothetical protein KC351_g1073 [Hortaea werneckii]